MVEYFGENPKTLAPNTFFSLFVKFVSSYKVRYRLLFKFPFLFYFSRSDSLSPGDCSLFGRFCSPKVRKSKLNASTFLILLVSEYIFCVVVQGPYIC